MDTGAVHQHRGSVLTVVLYSGVAGCGAMGALASGGRVMEIGNLSSIISVALAVLVAIVGSFRYITAQVESIRREMTQQAEGARLYADKVGEAEARQRHSVSNATQIITAKLESELRTLQREAVRQEQMDALEGRIQSALSKIETKVDKLADAVSEITAIKMTVTTMAARMERIADRLDEQSGKSTRP